MGMDRGMPGLALDGVEFGDTTLQSVMKAIDREKTFDAVEAMEGLSILDESFLEKVEMYQTQSWNDIKLDKKRPAPLPQSDDSELWQSLLLEQRSRYDEQIKKLNAELEGLCKTIKGETKRKDGFEREKWSRVNKILENYFNEYNVQI